ncbi:MAG: hypothetical protein JSU04_20350 [Bdellovibrionales bacterium]|nr:hypothetical protein [Bdellovibrionales bacterium]
MKKLIILPIVMLSAKVFAQEQTTSSTTSIPAASVTTTTTTTAKDPEKPKSNFGFVAISAMEVGAADIRDRNNHAAVNTTNALGLTYKTSDTSKIGFRQYFTYLRDTDNGSKFERSNTVVTYSFKTKGILGSDEIVPLFWYYIPVTEKALAERSNGKVRFTAYVNWTLNPKWGVTYFFDPRQGFTPSSISEDGKERFSHSTLIHGVSLSYNLSDSVSFYQGVGTTEDWKSSSLTLLDESVDISTGMYITLGPVLLIPDITNSIATRQAGVKPDSRSLQSSLYRAEDITYSVSMLASF